MSSISYVITVYNKSEAIDVLIEGLRGQRGIFDREFIFVDDGSTDNSFRLLNYITQGMNAVVVTQQNQGPSVALNTGLRLAKNEWTFLVDGDDYLYPDASQELLNLADDYPDAVVCRGKHHNNPLDYLYKFDNSITYIQDPLMDAIKFYPIGASTSIVRTDIAKEVGGCDERVFIQDYSIALRLARHGSFVEINNLIARNIDTQQVRLSDNKLRENYCTALARFLFLKDNLDIDDKYKLHGLQHALRKAWKWHLKNGFPPNLKHFARYIIARLPFFQIEDEKLIQWLRESLEVYKYDDLRGI